MTNSILVAIGGVIVGMLLMGLMVWLTMPSLMLIKHKTSHNYDEAIAIFSENLQKKQAWRMLSTNDYQASTAEFSTLERVCSVNVCNPRYAAKILTDDANRGVTAFMPLAIGIYEDKHGQVTISQLNVGLLGMMFGGVIAEVMKLAGRDLNEVVASVTEK